MRRWMAALAFLVLGGASARAQSVFGTYSTTNPQGGKVTFVLQQDAGGKVTGSLSGNGTTFNAEGLLRGGDVAGTLRNSSGGLYFEAHAEGNQLTVILVEPGANGQPDYTKARELSFTREAAGSPPMPATAVTPAPAPQGAPMGGVGGAIGAGTSAPPTGATAQDQQIIKLLLSTNWCSFEYKGGGGGYNSGPSYGRTSTQKARFGADGSLFIQSGSESTHSSQTGQVWGNNASAAQGRWKVENAQLYLAQPGGPWNLTQSNITYNSNGYPILKVNGTEYMMCN
jgi:hypothetical protein